MVASNWDFYSFPRRSPDGRWLAWTCWNAPLMPWDGTWYHPAEILGPGQLGEPVVIVGGPDKSVFQPEWSPDGVLHLVSDRNAWWNLYAWRDNRLSPVWTPESELGVAQWEFGYSTYAFLNQGRIAVLVQDGGQQALHALQDGTGPARTALYPLIPIVLAVLFLKERLDHRQVTGLLGAAIAVILLSL